MARATGGLVLLRIEDHDRQRCRPEFEGAILQDLETLMFTPDEPTLPALKAGATSPFRQRDGGAVYASAVAALEARGLVYACDCTRSTFGAWAVEHGRAWSGPGCPGLCATRGLTRAALGVTWRVLLGDGTETWRDLGLGPQTQPVATGGDLAIRDRHGNWTYGLCVVVDDLRHGVGLVIRGADLLEATAAQIQLARLLGRGTQALFLHHPLIRRPGGSKLSKADGATSVRELLAGGADPEAVRRAAAQAIGLPRAFSS